MSLDEIDRNLLEEVSQNPGTPVIDIIRPFLNKKSDSALRYRLWSLELEGYIKTRKQRDRVLVFPKNRGHEAHGSSESEAP